MASLVLVGMCFESWSPNLCFHNLSLQQARRVLKEAGGTYRPLWFDQGQALAILPQKVQWVGQRLSMKLYCMISWWID